MTPNKKNIIIYNRETKVAKLQVEKSASIQK